MSMGTVGVAPGTTTFTLQNGDVIALVDWVDDRLYSTIQIGNAQGTPLEAFGAALSQQIPGGTRPMTAVDTNVPRAGSNGLPQAYEMLIFSIQSEIQRVCRPPTGVAVAQPVLADGAGALSNPARLATLFEVNRLFSVTMKYREKVYAEGLMVDFPQGHGFSGFSTGSDYDLVQNGIVSPRDRNAMVLPVRLGEGLAYKVIHAPAGAPVIAQPASDGGVALAFVDIRDTFSGLVKRPVV